MNPSPKCFILYYSTIFVFSFVALLMITSSLTKSNGGCFLYGTVNSSNFSQGILKANNSVCSYVTSISIITTLVSIFMMMRNYWLIRKQIDRTSFSTFIMLIVNVFISVFVLVSCILISDGINSTCKSFHDCEQNSGYFSSIYYSMKTYEVFSWICWILWIIISIIYFIKMRYSFSNNDLLQSLAHEKQRLIKRQNYSVIVYEES